MENFQGSPGIMYRWTGPDLTRRGRSAQCLTHVLAEVISNWRMNAWSCDLRVIDPQLEALTKPCAEKSR